MKIGIIGIGSVGAAVATAVHGTGLVREIILIERDPVRSRAAAEDLGHAATFGFDVKIKDGRYEDLKNADVVIISAGANQKPGQTRPELVNANAKVIADIVPKVMRYAPREKIILVIVTNPLDAMVMYATKISGLPPTRVIGTGTMLDSARLRAILSRRLAVSPASVNAFVLGEHGDSSVINWSAATIGNIPLDDFCRQTKNPLTRAARETISYRVKNAAYEIIKGRGATWDGIGAAVADLLRAIANDDRRILGVSIVQGSVAMSLPRIIGQGGVALSLLPKLDKTESAELRRSATLIKKNFKSIK